MVGILDLVSRCLARFSVFTEPLAWIGRAGFPWSRGSGAPFGRPLSARFFLCFRRVLFVVVLSAFLRVGSRPPGLFPSVCSLVMHMSYFLMGARCRALLLTVSLVWRVHRASLVVPWFPRGLSLPSSLGSSALLVPLPCSLPYQQSESPLNPPRFRPSRSRTTREGRQLYCRRVDREPMCGL